MFGTESIEAPFGACKEAQNSDGIIMASAQEVLDAALGGEFGELHGNITRPLATALTAMVRRAKPRLAIEIGMAYGISTLAILAGLDEDARLISIDPYEHEHYHGFGLNLVARTGRSEQHQLCEEADYLALPRMLGEGASVDFAYVDGMHTFDYVLLDGFFVDKLLPVGGVVGFNDCGFRSVHKYLNFFRSHRDYDELDSGLRPNFRGRNPAVSLVRRIEGRSNCDRYFRKRSSAEPEGSFFRRF
jgi:predicted O-methyltransferase YrrM